MSKKRVYKVVEHNEQYYSSLDEAFSAYEKEKSIVASDLLQFRDVFLIVCDEDER